MGGANLPALARAPSLPRARPDGTRADRSHPPSLAMLPLALPSPSYHRPSSPSAVIHRSHARGVPHALLPSPVDDLPDELVELVLDCLHGRDLARAECVSVRLRRLCERDGDARWSRALARDFGDAFAPPPERRRSLPSGAMKREYRCAAETLRAIALGRAGAGFERPRTAVGTRIYGFA